MIRNIADLVAGMVQLENARGVALGTVRSRVEDAVLPLIQEWIKDGVVEVRVRFYRNDAPEWEVFGTSFCPGSDPDMQNLIDAWGPKAHVSVEDDLIAPRTSRTGTRFVEQDDTHRATGQWVTVFEGDDRNPALGVHEDNWVEWDESVWLRRPRWDLAAPL